MTLERIAPIGQASPVRRLAETGARPSGTGYAGALGFAQAAAADIRPAGAADALALTLDATAASLPGLSAGDVLLVKVVAVTPKLELSVFDADARPRVPAPESVQPAMRPDQLAWQRQLVARPPEAVALAASWRTTMLEQLEQQALQREHAEPWRTTVPRPALTYDAEVARLQRLPNALYGSPQDDRIHPAAVRGDEQGGNAASAQRPKDADGQPWLLTAYAWGGLRVLLRLLVVERDAPPPAKRRSSAVAIRLALVLADLGGVVVQLQLTPDGVLLDFAVERAAAQQALRERLPAVIAAVARADLCVARCRVAGGLLGEATAGAAGATVATTTAAAALTLLRLVQSHPSTAAALPLDLFRAAAEVVLALSSK